MRSTSGPMNSVPPNKSVYLLNVVFSKLSSSQINCLSCNRQFSLEQAFC